MKKIRITLQYDGTNYSGWQIQPDRTTIQGLLEEALKRITGAETKTVAAGRTDAGVHAIEQVVAFETSSGLLPEVFQRALNALLPEDIRVISAGYAEENFHPRYDAKSKSYVYIINNSSVKNPFLVRYAYYFGRRLDVERMLQASSYLIGRHDFRTFQASGCSAKRTVRTVKKIDILLKDSLEFLDFLFQGKFIVFRIEADAFLRYMVRNIVGTLIEAGTGKRPPEEIRDILLGRDRRLAGPTAPPQGLFLERIYY